MKIKGLLRSYRILKEIRIDPDAGIIKSGYGIRYLLFSDDMVSAIGDDLRKVVGRDMAVGLTYRMGYEAGIRFAIPIKERFRNIRPPITTTTARKRSTPICSPI